MRPSRHPGGTFASAGEGIGASSDPAVRDQAVSARPGVPSGVLLSRFPRAAREPNPADRGDRDPRGRPGHPARAPRGCRRRGPRARDSLGDVRRPSWSAPVCPPLTTRSSMARMPSAARSTAPTSDPPRPLVAARPGARQGRCRRVTRGGRRLAGGVERPGAGGGGGFHRRDRAWSPTGPGRTGWAPTAVEVLVWLTDRQRSYPSRGIGPIGLGGRGVRSHGGLFTSQQGIPCWPGKRVGRAAAAWRRYAASLFIARVVHGRGGDAVLRR